MNRIERIQAKIEQIETLCTEVKGELDGLGKEMNSTPKKAVKEKPSLPSEAECREEYERLYELFLTGDLISIENFVKSKGKDYLKVFCKYNYISVDPTKVSKARIAEEIKQRLAQRKAITKGVSVT